MIRKLGRRIGNAIVQAVTFDWEDPELPPTPVRVPAAWFECAWPGCAALAPSWDGQAPEGWTHDRCPTGGSAAYCPAHGSEHASPVTRADFPGRGGT